MASKAQYLKKRTVLKLSDVLDRKFDPGKGNPKTVNPNKKKSIVPRKPDYFSEAVQGLAYKAGLVDQPSAQAVREEAYKAGKGGGPKKRQGSSSASIRDKGKSGGGPKKRQGSSSASMKASQPVSGGARPETPGSYMPKRVSGGARPETPGSYMPKRSSSTATATPTSTAGTSTAGTGTGTGAEMKLSAFEKMKARLYEKDVGPSTMSKKRIRERIQKERQYKSPLGGLFKRKGN
jgi:hypothetical protein